ncbi:hypothetical protein ABAC460_16420 [Asticcacaulis sp. AC460]|uniref:hypothetical protein n=1 Tax=Asticcacaulis sp. AC460 TaxID=1282360 RepID=UPI0003C3BF33|nr:hypothetical protein [Asticcacaulis sp. AC460]ESQ88243.1 hypothetical protein ABAC460_16420 [Asticcacaulis sp. AC460]
MKLVSFGTFRINPGQIQIINPLNMDGTPSFQVLFNGREQVFFCQPGMLHDTFKVMYDKFVSDVEDALQYDG